MRIPTPDHQPKPKSCDACPNAAALRKDIEEWQRRAEDANYLLLEQVAEGYARKGAPLLGTLCVGPRKDGCPVEVAIRNLMASSNATMQDMLEYAKAGLKAPALPQEPTKETVPGMGPMFKCWEGSRLDARRREDVQRVIDEASVAMKAAEAKGKTRPGVLGRLRGTPGPYDKNVQTVANGLSTQSYVQGALGACTLCLGTLDRPKGVACPNLNNINPAFETVYRFLNNPDSPVPPIPKAPPRTNKT